MSKLLKIKFVVLAGHKAGDYAVLYGNAGAGAIDWNAPLSEELNLFPNGLGIKGWGHSPWQGFRWCHSSSDGPSGWGHLPWCKFNWCKGSALIEASYTADECGSFLFGFKAHDEAGNIHEGSPEELIVSIHIDPPAPSGLEKVSYDKGTDILILEAA